MLGSPQHGGRAGRKKRHKDTEDTTHTRASSLADMCRFTCDRAAVVEAVVGFDEVHDLALVGLSREVARRDGVRQLVGRLARVLRKHGQQGGGRKDRSENH